jgi:surfeit locus 1 family protein
MKSLLLTLLTLLLTLVLSSLGYWQLSRAHQKEALLQAAAAHQALPPLTAQTLVTQQDKRFYRVQLTGHFDNAHTVLLDNTLYHGQVGYEVYTPFFAQHINTPFLVDRGFIAMGQSREHLPPIRPIIGTVTLKGRFNQPPRYHVLGTLYSEATTRWPLRVEFIELVALQAYLPYVLSPDLIQIDPKDVHAYPLEWVSTVMSPERHYAYAFQWFALALTLLIIWVTLFIRKRIQHP